MNFFLHFTSEILLLANNSLIESVTNLPCYLAEWLFGLKERGGSNLKGILYPSRIVPNMKLGASILSQNARCCLSRPRTLFDVLGVSLPADDGLALENSPIILTVPLIR